MYDYKDLGLCNTTEMFHKAYRGRYAVPALNFISIEQFNAIMDACGQLSSPVILLASPNLHRQLGGEVLARIAQSGVDRLCGEGRPVPVCLHLDHGMTFEQCQEAIESGFSSVMIDGSALAFEENVALTKQVVDYAHARDVSVEAELGVLSGAEETGDAAHDAVATDPAAAEEFVARTGVDSLAIAIGTSHGLVKLKPLPDGSLPELRYEILAEVERRLPGFPIVLHGSSSIGAQYIEMINAHGGKVEAVQGIPEEQIARAARMAVCKINIASDGWIAALALTRKILHENPGAIDSRVFTLPVREELAGLYRRKIELFGSAGKA